MNCCLWINVFDDDAMFRFKDELCFRLLCNNFTKYTVLHHVPKGDFMRKNGAESRTRTDTVSLPRDFESRASAISPSRQLICKSHSNLTVFYEFFKRRFVTRGKTTFFAQKILTTIFSLKTYKGMENIISHQNN